MALNVETIKNMTRGIVYGSGLGEKPSIVTAASSSGASVSGGKITFNLATGYGAKIRAGDILSTMGASSSSGANTFYVLSVSGDSVTCINSYDGSTAGSSSTVDGALFEVMPLVTEYQIYNAIDVVVETFLWPEVFEIVEATVTPDLTSGQVALNAADEEILHAFQKVGSIIYPISFHLEKAMDSSLFSSGRMGSFDFIDGSTTYYAAKRRISTSTSTGATDLYMLIATGAAAIALGGTQIETSLDSSKKDSQEREQLDPTTKIWRNFITLKQVYSEDLSRDTVMHFVIERD